MSRGLIAGALVLIAGFAGVESASGAGPRDESRVKVRMIAGRFVTVPVTVNGTGPYRFLLDTGATSTMLDPALVVRLRLPAAGSAVEQTATRSEATVLVRASLALGGVTCLDLAVIASPLDAVQALEPAIVGVLGQDLLRTANWWLDYEGGQLVADAEGRYLSRDLGEAVPVHWHSNRPAVDARLPGRGSLRLVLDSAASSALLFREVMDSEDAGWARLTTHDGQATTRQVVLGPIQLGGLEVPPFPAAMLASAPSERPEDGLLPTGLFTGVYFDNRSDVVVLNPRRSVLSKAR